MKNKKLIFIFIIFFIAFTIVSIDADTKTNNLEKELPQSIHDIFNEEAILEEWSNKNWNEYETFINKETDRYLAEITKYVRLSKKDQEYFKEIFKDDFRYIKNKEENNLEFSEEKIKTIKNKTFDIPEDYKLSLQNRANNGVVHEADDILYWLFIRHRVYELEYYMNSPFYNENKDKKFIQDEYQNILFSLENTIKEKHDFHLSNKVNVKLNYTIMLRHDHNITHVQYLLGFIDKDTRDTKIININNLIKQNVLESELLFGSNIAMIVQFLILIFLILKLCFEFLLHQIYKPK